MSLAMLQTFLLALIALYAVRSVVAHLCTWYYFSRYARINPTTGYAPPVSIIKPTRGVDALAMDNFRSFCKQEYPNVYELLFCVEEPDDPVVPLIQALIAAYPHRDVRLLVSDPQVCARSPPGPPGGGCGARVRRTSVLSSMARIVIDHCGDSLCVSLVRQRAKNIPSTPNPASLLSLLAATLFLHLLRVEHSRVYLIPLACRQNVLTRRQNV
jgi:cellulose synthase/poly-beta-1,6-N-acetylglucosamine synthase-like glycosyltransferase